MTQKDKQIELKNKIVEGLDKVYEKLIDFKKSKNSELVVMQGDEIVRIKP